MHIKQKPMDFVVEEITSCDPGEHGDFAFYSLEKQGWTTPDAVAIIRKRWKVDARRISVGGLKDRHAQTRQYLTIYRGPQRKLTHANLQLSYLGKLAEPFESQHIDANRFAITVRAMTEAQVAAAFNALDEVKGAGVPNYYDDQRFGSVVLEGVFLAKEIILGEHETALRLALTAPYAFERSAAKKEKAVLRKHWGDWRTCAAQLPRGATKRIVEHLVHHPADFRGALEHLPTELRTLYLSAYQSHLWNHMLVDWVGDHIPPHDLTPIALRLGEVPMPRRLDPELREHLHSLQLPLHSARIHLDDDDSRKPYFDRVLTDEGLTQEQFKLKGFRALFFSKGDRAAWCFPQDLDARGANDE
jgi:tRNA pseudouridine13 synthase